MVDTVLRQAVVAWRHGSCLPSASPNLLWQQLHGAINARSNMRADRRRRMTKDVRYLKQQTPAETAAVSSALPSLPLLITYQPYKQTYYGRGSGGDAMTGRRHTMPILALLPSLREQWRGDSMTSAADALCIPYGTRTPACIYLPAWRTKHCQRG